MTLTNILELLSLAVAVSAIPYGPPSSHTFRKRALPSLDIFPSDDTSQKHKSLLSEALSDTLLLVQQVSLSYPGDDGSGPFKDVWSKYFPDTDHKAVQGVWNKIMSDPKNPGQGEAILTSAAIVGVDLVKQTLKQEICDGQTEAYTNPLPADAIPPDAADTSTFTFFCDEAFTLPGRFGDISCTTVGDTLSNKMEFLGGTILHEWMHNDGIGKAGTGGDHIGDFTTPQDSRAGYGPFKTRQLLKNNPSQCIVNADNFLYLAYEILWTNTCLTGDNPRFKDPASDTSVDSTPSPSLTGTISTSFSMEPAPTATIPVITSAASTSPTSSAPAASVTCFHAADPDGAMGLCPDIANSGWCDCGSAGTFSNLSGSNVCGYTTVPTTGSVTLTSCQSTTTQIITETVIPVPASTTVSPTAVSSSAAATSPTSSASST